MKICCTCKQEKLFTEFNKNKSTKDGLHKQCKDCLRSYRQKNSEKIKKKIREHQQKNSLHRKEYLKKYREENKDAIKEKINKWREENKEELKIKNSRRNKIYKEQNPKSVMLYSAKQRAKKNNLDFDITENDFEIPEYCPILGLKLTSEEGKPSDSSASLDKIIPELGYVVGNIQVISRLANMMKNKATIEQLKLFALWVNNNFGEKK